ncbi:hypothetical protein P8C59_000296 [Phyllachora maydis]|uniref:Uncharacterized protein n=1 Tax=Phyllachora maydis TaxID=1825666 RepID=A0AAD9MB18_9PEZI|nr:hypothetical protein P8C59_000296 [Phyllachora maydis]
MYVDFSAERQRRAWLLFVKHEGACAGLHPVPYVTSAQSKLCAATLARLDDTSHEPRPAFSLAGRCIRPSDLQQSVIKMNEAVLCPELEIILEFVEINDVTLAAGTRHPSLTLCTSTSCTWILHQTVLVLGYNGAVSSTTWRGSSSDTRQTPQESRGRKGRKQDK